MKTLIAYWSGTGNTAQMAEFIAKALKEKGHEAVLFDTTSGSVSGEGFDFYFLGCPSMGVEELEDSTFLPFYEGLKGQLVNKKVILFGSYGWGDGEWMRTWETSAKADGLDVVKTFIFNEAPSNESFEEAKKALELVK